MRPGRAGEGTTLLRRGSDGRWRSAYVGRWLRASVEGRGTRTCGILGANVGGGVVPGVKAMEGLRVVRAAAFVGALNRIDLERWAFPGKVVETHEADVDGPRRVLELPPGPGNPRNSEGSFIKLRDGRILMIYSRYYGQRGGDHDPAVLSQRESRDGGFTWSTNDVDIVKNEGGGKNVMSVSLLRLANGEIALFYLRKNAGDDCFPVVRFSDDEAKTWSAPVKCIDQASKAGFCVLNNDRVIQLPCGRILLPIALNCTIFCLYSDDNGRTWKKRKVLEGNVYDGGWFCYTAMLEEGDAVLLEYCCLKHLCHSRITRVPLKWIYGPDPKGGPTTLEGYFED